MNKLYTFYILFLYTNERSPVCVGTLSSAFSLTLPPIMLFSIFRFLLKASLSSSSLLFHSFCYWAYCYRVYGMNAPDCTAPNWAAHSIVHASALQLNTNSDGQNNRFYGFGEIRKVNTRFGGFFQNRHNFMLFERFLKFQQKSLILKYLWMCFSSPRLTHQNYSK